MSLRFVLTIMFLFWSTATGYAEKLKVVAWNLESGEANPSFISGQIADFAGVDLWGFSEVELEDAAAYATACAVGETGQQFKHFVGSTGWSDRLVIVWNATKLELMKQDELLELKAQTGRAPLMGVFKVKSTGEHFIFMVNHLHRGSPAKRMEQAIGLEQWAKNQQLPAIVVGDFNFDVKVSTKKGNPAFEAMTDEGAFRWVEPMPFRATHKGGSVLDFVFLTGPAKAWAATSEVFKLSDDEVDTLQGTDHRPVLADLDTAILAKKVSLPTAKPATEDVLATSEAENRQKTRNEILRRLTELERDLVILRRLVRELAE